MGKSSIIIPPGPTREELLAKGFNLDADAPSLASISPIEAMPLSAFVTPTEDDPQELLKHRYLCRQAFMVLCGPTGIGKSALGMQCAIMWALQKEAFGIAPAEPLTSLFIQAENDGGDIAEMRDGVFAGLGLTPAQRETASGRIFIHHENSKTGTKFLEETVRPLLEIHPDLLWIDPALAYLGGDTCSQKDVGVFLRNGLNPLLKQFNCGAVIIHHTNKPPSGKEKQTFQAGDFAYQGSGSAEWANSARAVLVIRSIGSHDVFELRAAKRGVRLGWQDAQGGRSFTKCIAHSAQPGVIFWHEVDPKDVNRGGRPKSFTDTDILSVLPPDGLATTEWLKAAHTENNVPRSTFFRLRRAVEAAGRIKSVSGKWQPINK